MFRRPFHCLEAGLRGQGRSPEGTSTLQGRIAKVLLAKGLVRPLREHELFRINGQPLLNGAFGVAKPGKLTPEGKEVQRFIMDLRPSNHLQLPIVGDIASLAGPCKWLNLVLPQGQV